MNKSEWQQDVIPAQCLRFKLIKTALGTKINGVEVEHIQTAEEIVESAWNGN
jgi:hypothetical protein